MEQANDGNRVVELLARRVRHEEVYAQAHAVNQNGNLTRVQDHHIDGLKSSPHPLLTTLTHR